MNIIEQKMARVLAKIEHIRLQPENIRMRYVWGSVAISMFIILIIWIVSINAMLQRQEKSPKQNDTGEGDITKQIQNLKQQAPSLKDFSDQQISAGVEGVATTPNSLEAR